MIVGTVNKNYEAVISLVVRGPTGISRKIEAVIDAGFSGFLTLPFSIIVSLHDLRIEAVAGGKVSIETLSVQ